MKDNFNILLCYDSNYNIQGQVTIMSLLENTNSKLNFHIIHEAPEKYLDLSEKIINHNNLNTINFYKFKKRNEIDFPNFDHSHMSEATYYRLFLGDYLPSDIKKIVYVDPDIVCINNFDKLFQSTFNKLNNSEFIISARTEHFEDNNSEVSQRLALSNNKYFNAGVTFINYEKWVKNNLTEKLTKHMNYLGDRVFWYDQDVLNSYLDGQYVELSPELNFTDLNIELNEVINNAVLYHFWGKRKPWTVKGFIFYGDSFYQKFYRQLFKNYYHIVHVYKKDSLKHFFVLIMSLKIFKLQSPLKFIKNFIYTLFK